MKLSIKLLFKSIKVDTLILFMLFEKMLLIVYRLKNVVNYFAVLKIW